MFLGESASLLIHVPPVRAGNITQGIYQDPQASSPAASAQRYMYQVDDWLIRVDLPSHASSHT